MKYQFDSRIERSARESGMVLLTSLLVAIVLGGIAVSLLTVTTAVSGEQLVASNQLQVRYLAEAAVQDALVELRAGGDGNVGSASSPIAFNPGQYYAFTVDNGNNSYTTTGVGIAGGRTKAMRALIRGQGGIFDYSMFAGNDSGDPNYVMKFGGKKPSADLISGDIYSGGDIKVSDDAELSGVLRAKGTIEGHDGYEGVSQPIPDIAGMKYETTHDVNVAAEFSKYGSYKSDNAGGSAYQVAEKYASHIFRKNPSDRRDETRSTSKSDYFLEDPYESTGTISLSGYAGESGAKSNEKVFFIDGNLWVHNLHVYSTQFKTDKKSAMKVTFIVKGNIYLSDNLRYGDKDKDGIALIAIKDEDYSDSGNIYFGDPRYGTLEEMHAFMYAENNFYDNNLQEEGSEEIVLRGTMSAGNQVLIQRDFKKQYSRFVLDYDDRILAGELSLPGLPTQSKESSFQLVGWHETAVY